MMPSAMRKFILLCYVIVFNSTIIFAENGYHLWLRYQPIAQQNLNDGYKMLLSTVFMASEGNTMIVIRQEIGMAASKMLGISPKFTNTPGNGLNLVLTSQSKYLPSIKTDFAKIGEEGFVIQYPDNSNKNAIYIIANSETGLLYGVFHLLRLASMETPLAQLEATERPLIKWRMLNHWDNLTRTVERGYAGQSIWNWHTLPGHIEQRYIDYARANASVGINAVALTNVNANATILTPMYLEKVKALADVFRPYGIRVFLTARFSAPIEIGKLKTADPLDADVKKWWSEKADEIYKLIPDFGGFLVKANSEGQPGPQNYGRNHDDGANMLALALKPHKGVVIWRAFVYSNETPEDRYKQPYAEFVPLDGKFEDNVMVQVKNGAIDFQPREPFHPLFGAMAKTPTMMEFQLTQEYLGFATHLVYMAPMFKEVLDADTYRPRQGSTVAKVIEGSAFNYQQTGMAGVANIGSDINWTGHPFGQANWYTLGRLAWNHQLTSENIAREWIMQTFSRKPTAIKPIMDIMLQSHEAVVNYMTPLGLHHIMGYGHHYGPAPWFDKASREDWNCTYFHRASEKGIGFDRTATGSNALAQYAEPWQKQWGKLETAGRKWLTWFHHVPWDYKLENGKTFWDNLALAYQEGVDSVASMQKQWQSVEAFVDKERFRDVSMRLQIQYNEAVWWRDACLSYFQTFSKRPLPAGVSQPAYSLENYKSLRFPYAPGNTH
jgi:alpha-glucuronidase